MGYTPNIDRQWNGVRSYYAIISTSNYQLATPLALVIGIEYWSSLVGCSIEHSDMNDWCTANFFPTQKILFKFQFRQTNQVATSTTADKPNRIIVLIKKMGVSFLNDLFFFYSMYMFSYFINYYTLLMRDAFALSCRFLFLSNTLTSFFFLIFLIRWNYTKSLGEKPQLPRMQIHKHIEWRFSQQMR